MSYWDRHPSLALAASQAALFGLASVMWAIAWVVVYG